MSLFITGTLLRNSSSNLTVNLMHAQDCFSKRGGGVCPYSPPPPPPPPPICPCGNIHNYTSKLALCTFPDFGEKRGFCIFIASSVTSAVPSSTCSSTTQSTALTTPGIGARRVFSWASWIADTLCYTLD